MEELPELPPKVPLEDIETRAVLKKLPQCRAALAEVKGVTGSVPNQQILIDTLSLQEAKHSSAVENIVTTHDEMYKGDHGEGRFASPAAKEVHHYADALKSGFRKVKEKGLITTNMILEVQKVVMENDAGIRKLPGTVLRNEQSGETIFEPPQDPERIKSLLKNLEHFMNDGFEFDTDPLIKMALIHYQFESIHPFYDGNGRTGRIINLLYLIKEGLLDLPVLYISRYIIRNREKYYALLQDVRERDAWEEWTLYMLDAVERTAKETVRMIEDIGELMLKTKHRIKREAPKIYSQDLINNLFRHPYTKIAFLEKDLGIHRLTARKYLEILTGMGILEKIKLGRTNYYINKDLFELLEGAGEQRG